MTTSEQTPDEATGAAKRAAVKARALAARLQGGSSQQMRKLLAFGLVMMALVFGWQAWQLHKARNALHSVQVTVQNAVPLVQRSLDGVIDAMTTAATDPLVREMAARGTDEGRVQAADRISTLLPDATDVAVFSTSPDALLDSGNGSLGYLRAAQLAEAQSSSRRQVSAGGHQSADLRLSVVEPILAGGKPVAFAAAALPFTGIERTLHSDIHPPSGRIELRLGPDETSVLLDSNGITGRTAVDVAQQLTGTSLWLTGTRALPNTWFSTSIPPAFVAVLGLLCLLGATSLTQRERMHRMRAAAEARRAAKANEKPVFAEVVDEIKKAPTQAEPPTSSDGTDPGATGMAVDADIFRAYDIRGVVGKTLDADVARALGRAIGSEARDRGQHEIVVGRDGRLSGPMLSEALIEGLRSTGMDVVDIGQAPTPLVYFACHELDTGSGVAVTGSHNPPDYNGFKIVLGGETLATDAIQDLALRISEGRFQVGQGKLREVDISDAYVERIADDVQVQRPLKVVVDCGNGVTGEVGPRVLEEIGCQVLPLYEEIDGNFPNHHPDPSDPANLADLLLAVQHQDADLGIAFDGDGDRLGVVTAAGDVIYPDRLLMLFAMDVLVRDPGATIIYDVKCTGHLQPFILRHGGSPVMCKTGHSLIKAEMRKTGAALAGEMSGHFFFRERWFGFDDGIYAAARLLEILAGDLDERTPEAIFATLPKGVSTPELKVVTEEGENHLFVEQFLRQASFPDARITRIDGLRADWPDGWGLVRASNTTPSLVLRFDADNERALERIKNVFRKQILALAPELKLPF